MMLDIAARLTRGWAMPDDNNPPIKRRRGNRFY